ncbi:MAG TPA: DUF4097 family beta strand repeat-containing protein [Pyrinomonadaceae bacterium]|jgi:hypothetical protein
MKTSTLLALLCSLALLSSAISGTAQQQIERTQEIQRSVEPGPTIERQVNGRVSFKLERGGRLSVDNRSTGRITVIGWDRDTVEAVATSERGVEIVRSGLNTNAAGTTSVWLKADYAESEEQALKRREFLEARRKILVAGREAISEMRQEMQEEVAKKREEIFGAQPQEQKEQKPEEQPPTRQPSVAPQQQKQPQPTAQPSTPAREAVPTPPSMSTQTPPSIFPTPPAPKFALQGEPPFTADGRPIEINLEVRVPRYAQIEPVRVWRSAVEIKGIETPLIIIGEKSGVILDQVGAVEVKTRSGPVEVSNAGGLVDVITTSGPVKVSNAASDVRALSISGAVDIKCARGRVDVSNTDGPITLFGIGGDVDANSANSNVYLMGPIREDGSYHLKSMSGMVELKTRPPASLGLTVTLSSYRGGIETDFPIRTEQGTQINQSEQRLIGRFGNGRAQIMLDSFDGPVKFKKAGANELLTCN